MGTPYDSGEDQRAGHPVRAGRANELVAIDIPFSRCAACEQTWSSSFSALRPYSFSWYEAWRVKCGFLWAAVSSRREFVPAEPGRSRCH